MDGNGRWVVCLNGSSMRVQTYNMRNVALQTQGSLICKDIVRQSPQIGHSCIARLYVGVEDKMLHNALIFWKFLYSHLTSRCCGANLRDGIQPQLRQRKASGRALERVMTPDAQ